jgi:hypothetical protein
MPDANASSEYFNSWGEEAEVQKWIAPLLLCAALAGGYSYWRNHLRSANADATEQAQEVEAKPAAQDGDPAVKVVGPLAELMDKAETLNPLHKPDPVKPHASRYIGQSAVGTSNVILHKTFALKASVNFPFEVPAYAFRPQLHGRYRSFVKEVGIQDDEDIANVDLLILNEAQYSDFVRGGGSEAVFSADASHDQNVNFGLPPTQDHSQKYYLVFQNTPGGASRKLVQADFTVDF